MIVPEEKAHPDQLYRLILDHALDAFVAIDEHSRIIEWSLQAEKSFGWSRQEALGMPLVETIIPERYRAAHYAGLKRYLERGQHKILGRQVEMVALRRDGSEFPIELTVTSINIAGRNIFSAAIRDISLRRALEETVHRQEAITRSVLASMGGAVVVADLSQRIIMVNPAGQHLLKLDAAEADPGQSWHDFPLLQPDGKTPYPDSERPTPRALRGEHVSGLVACVRHGEAEEETWVSVNAKPLIDENGAIMGAAVVFHDITGLRRREEELVRQADRLREQASLLDLAQEAILVRDPQDVITYWNRSAERLYGYAREEALGRVCHELLATRFPQPLAEIEAIVRKELRWEGELVQTAKDGREVIVFSQWALDVQNGQPLRYLETNTDITQRVEAERALHQSRENYRMLVEATTEYAIIMIDPEGCIVSWNTGAEYILGLSPEEAVGQVVASLFTQEDRDIGEPLRELEEARLHGRSEDDRWHIRKDGTRFWATGVVTPVWNQDGSLRGYVKIMRDQTAHRLAEEQTQFLASHDALTGLPNRVQFSSQLHQAIARSERNRIPFAVLLLDLDKFKQVNDTYGHHVGDLLLKEVALRILSTLRETDFVARLGGDEFVVIQADVAQPEAAEILARKLILALGRPYLLDGSEVISGTSVGICTYPVDGVNSVELVKRADLALYRAKSAGRGTFQFYTHALFSERMQKKDREQALRNALKNGQFLLYYQPQIDLGSWKVSTVEALLRWQATELEMVLPDDFLGVAEESGIIVEIGQWALRQACAQVRQWQEKGLDGLRISVNCSARQFSDPGFMRMIRPTLEEAGLAPSSLELEITEAMLAQHAEIKEQVACLRELGVRVTIDNYGTGAASLIDLKEFEVDGLKIDKAFVQHLPHRRKDSAIASAIISLAHDLGIGVSAGGVETAEQLAYLKARECTSAQGFIFSPPVPPQEFEELMFSGNWSRINRLPMTDGPKTFNDFH